MPRVLEWENNTNRARYGDDDVWLETKFHNKTLYIGRYFLGTSDKRLVAVVRDNLTRRDGYVVEFHSVRAAMRWCETMATTGALE